MPHFKVVSEKEVYTHYLTDDKVVGFKFRRSNPDQQARWRSKATIQENKRGRAIFKFDQEMFDGFIWNECIIDVFGFVDDDGKDVAITSKKQLPGSLWKIMCDIIVDEETGENAEENGAGPLAQKNLS